METAAQGEDRLLLPACEGRSRLGVPVQSWLPVRMGKGRGSWVLVELEDRDCRVKGRQAWGLTRRFLGRMRGLFCPFIL